MPQAPLLDERDRLISGATPEGSPLGVALGEDDAALGNEPMMLADGSAMIPIPEEESPAGKHFDNLVSQLEISEKSLLAQDVFEWVERDKTAREKRDKQYSEAIERSGLSGDAPGGAGFAGSSKAVHPMLAEACVDFAARAMKELFPPDGPTKVKIWGRADEKKEERAKRKKDWLNWQLTSSRGRQAIREYRAELEQLLTQLPLGGSEFLKLWHDGRRIRAEFIPVDRILLPYAAVDFYTSPRITHWQKLTRQEFESRVRNGVYEDVERKGIAPSNEPETSKAEESREKVEGKEPSAYNEDGLRDVYEMQVSYELSVDSKETAPYIVTWDEATNEILSVRRNWAQDDDTQERLDWLVKWGLIPWSGAFDLGLWHLIGSLSIAGTGALRALLDSGHINNAPSALKLKGRGAGENVVPQIGEVTEIDAPPNVDDIRKIAMPFPFNQPSPVLYQLLEWVTAAGKSVIGTADEKIADATNQMPVGTALALIEQGSITYSAIHARLHSSQARALEIISRLNSEHLDEQDAAKELGGEAQVTRADFLPPHDISPVSDPNVFSDSQRYAQNQGLLQLSADQRVKYNVYELHRRVLRVMKIDDVDAILPPLPTPQRLDPVAENVAVFGGTPIVAFPDQEQLAHLKTHLDFILSPAGGGNPLVGPKVVAPLLEHCSQHLVFYYLQKMMETGRDVSMQTGLPPDETLAAATSELAQSSIMKDLQPLLDAFGKAMQIAQQYAPKPPMDPRAQALLEASKLETQRKAAADQALAAQRGQEAETKSRLDALMAEMKARDDSRKQEVEFLLAKMQAESEQSKNHEDNVTKMVTELLKNHEDNIVEIVKAQAAVTARPRGQGTSGGGNGGPERIESVIGSIEELLARARSIEEVRAAEAEEARRRAEEEANAPPPGPTPQELMIQALQALLQRSQEQAAQMAQTNEALMQGMSGLSQGVSGLSRTVRAPRRLEYDAAGNPVRSYIEEDD